MSTLSGAEDYLPLRRRDAGQYPCNTVYGQDAPVFKTITAEKNYIYQHSVRFAFKINSLDKIVSLSYLHTCKNLKISSAKVVCCNIPCKWKIHLQHEGSINLPLLV